MFVLSPTELRDWRSQFVISKADRTGIRHPLMAFTEQGVAMLSSVLRSKRAITVNIEIMRAFVKLRQMLASNAELARRLDELESKYDTQFRIVFDAIRKLTPTPIRDQRDWLLFALSEKVTANRVGSVTKPRAHRFLSAAVARPVLLKQIPLAGSK